MSYFGICPLRDGAGLVLFLSPSFDPSSGSFVSATVRRSGESGDIIWLVRVVLNRSAVTVCALAAGTDSAINTRHGKAARAAVPAGCWPRPHEIKYSNENKYLMNEPRARSRALR